MSNIILDALERLENSVEKLDGAAQKVGAAVPAKGKNQQDMFSAFTGKKPAPANKGQGGNVVDAAAFAKRLDNAIEKVENLLKEGRA